jgi:broad specificity phosphatase PhoE
MPADLSDTARIERLKAHLPDQAILVSSDLVRARATADAVTGPAHRRLPHDPHLREMHFGVWDGMHFEEVSERDPVLSRAFWEKPGDIAAPGGESWNAVSHRVETAVRRISARHPGQHIIAVAHFGGILTQLQRALGASAYDTLAHKIDNLSVTTIEWRPEGAIVPRINHLP